VSLLWKNAAAYQMVRTAAWAPDDSEEHIHPGELEGGYYPTRGTPLRHHDVFGDGSHVKRMADSIRQHGYDPARHGQLGLNIADHGENVYNHATGSESHPELGHFNHEHLLQALKDSGHGEVPVHVHDQRSEEGGASAPRYYHGTTAEDLQEVHPNHGSRGNFGNNGGIHEPGYAYATGRGSAEHYADTAAMTHGGRAHVYEVSPKGPVEVDPKYDAHGNNRGNQEDDVRSKHGFQVINEEDLGHDDEDEDEDHEGHGEW
jgi:hypothetical protein